MNDNPTLAELNEMLAEELARHDLNIVSCAIISGLMNDVTARAEAAEARVAELEAQIAAQQWRPVTEEPDADDMYPVRVKYRGQVYLDREMRNWNRASGWNDMFAQSKVVEWYPLPPAPQEPTQ